MNRRTIKALRIGAVVCVALAVVTFCMMLLGGSFPDRELVISRKYTSESGSQTQFRVYSELPYPQRGFAYDTTVSRGFYDAIKTGDVIRSPLTGYLQLVRDERVVAHYLAQELIVPTIYSFLALLPVVAFLERGPSPFPRVFFAVVGLLEILVVGAFLYGAFASCC